MKPAPSPLNYERQRRTRRTRRTDHAIVGLLIGTCAFCVPGSGIAAIYLGCRSFHVGATRNRGELVLAILAIVVGVAHIALMLKLLADRTFRL